jgi:hypothetical protein
MSGQLNVDVIQTSSGASLGGGNATLMKNRLIDAGFTINQRGYVSGTALSAGTYAHDRWKAGTGGATYTFTQGSLGVPITITITAGSLQQIIEGANIPDGGTFILSWTGTAQGRVNGGTYSASPLVVTGIVAGSNTTIEFNTGTVYLPQFEVGSSATSFEYRYYGHELSLCQRYYQVYADSAYRRYCMNVDRTPYPIPQMRTFATVIITSQTNTGLAALSIYMQTVNSVTIDIQYTGGGNGVVDFSSLGYTLSAEL